MLYLIEILHQTTTPATVILSLPLLYLIEILHQTTTRMGGTYIRRSCILSKFYIKPQRVAGEGDSQAVVSYRNSTSNHNGSVDVLPGRPVVSYRNSTSNHNFFSQAYGNLEVVSYRNSTSNHNNKGSALGTLALYLIEILHQTTTPAQIDTVCAPLYLIEILHQTTTIFMAISPWTKLYLIEILHQTTTAGKNRKNNG